MSETLAGVRQSWNGRRAGVRLVIAALTGAALTLAAPWGTGQLHWIRRAAEFLAACLLWEACVPAAMHLLRPRMRAAPVAASVALGVLAASAPATAGIYVVQLLASDPPGSVLELYVRSLGLGLVLAFARRGLSMRATPVVSAVSGPAPSMPEPERDFLLRHAPALGGRTLLALEAEDHYLRVHTDAGSTLVLLRMRDAIAELGADAGWQLHRSFWLSRTAGGRAERRGQSWRIVLANGLSVPVSKSAVAAMRAAGYGPPASAAA